MFDAKNIIAGFLADKKVKKVRAAGVRQKRELTGFYKNLVNILLEIYKTKLDSLKDGKFLSQKEVIDIGGRILTSMADELKLKKNADGTLCFNGESEHFKTVRKLKDGKPVLDKDGKPLTEKVKMSSAEFDARTLYNIVHKTVGFSSEKPNLPLWTEKVKGKDGKETNGQRYVDLSKIQAVK